ncbi:Kynurenine/Oxoglutarate Transaminase [Ectocarpus siliculosus]|uniref:Kynurenine/Oxoglutarate Transaminase n=1 Tax=Ectocarpus siliculosus TaxID=2880 RepID=D8LE79_ECTSI|nr:Kynurenine/Oxoglutarate Transaminase [Ectocarpus siliculosus]|eukprot:CBN74154.1 Kynurenine/Oxoglutarate Transaminase [Ectocarpus siliculosus]
MSRSRQGTSLPAQASNNGANGGLNGGGAAAVEGLAESVSAAVPSPAGDDVCFEGGCPAEVEPPHGANPEELEIPALREMKSSSAGPTVWSEFSSLAAETGAPVNLGQGFPNWNPPDFVVAAAQKALSEGFHQYTRTAGHPRLVQLLAKRYSKHFGREVDPFSQVAITIGASQALYVSFQAILSPGDEVVLLEPFFDLYLGQIRMAGGVAKQVPLSVVDGEWRLDAEALRRAISPRTRAIVVNTPHNPTGKVFSRQELEAIADVVRENPRLLVISDEVYKYMVYEGLGSGGEDGTATTTSIDPADAAAALQASKSTTGDNVGSSSSSNGSSPRGVVPPESEGRSSAAREAPPAEVAKKVDDVGVVEPLPALRHVHFATLPGMWDRTITISSAGKTFSVTGWQVGWVLGPQRVIQEIHTILPYMQFCAATPMQEAMCTVLVDAEKPYEGSPSYYDWLREQYSGKRHRLEGALAAAGIQSLKGEGGFFLIGDVTKIKVPEKYLKASTPAMPVMTHDWAFCRWLAIEHGLVAIPTSPFFSEDSRKKGLGNGLVRFCFCKTDETIEAAAEVLMKMAEEQAQMEGSIAAIEQPAAVAA